MHSKLKSIGLNKAYKPYWDGDPDAGSICLTTRKFRIVDGELDGAEIDVYSDRVIRVWTSQKKKAKAIANANEFQVRFFEGEAELYIPAERADEFLHDLGAKVKMKRVLTPEQKAEVAARFKAARARTS